MRWQGLICAVVIITTLRSLAFASTDLWGQSFDSTSQLILLTGGLSTGVAAMADSTVRDEWRDYQKMDPQTAKAGRELGDGLTALGLALGQYAFDRENGTDNLKSLLAVTFWSTGLKAVTQRQRPGGGHYNSFPSGHTATAFVEATSFAYSYGWEVGVPAYALATGVGLSRMAEDVHWFSDVVAGAFIGIWLGRAYHHNLFTNCENESCSSTSVNRIIYPSVENGAAFINVLSLF